MKSVKIEIDESQIQMIMYLTDKAIKETAMFQVQKKILDALRSDSSVSVEGEEKAPE